MVDLPDLDDAGAVAPVLGRVGRDPLWAGIRHVCGFAGCSPDSSCCLRSAFWIGAEAGRGGIPGVLVMCYWWLCGLASGEVTDGGGVRRPFSAWRRDMAVVVISSVRGGRPEAGWSDLQIRHLVPATNWGNMVAGENRADAWRWWRSAP